jgi:O-antigen ligase
MLYEAKQVNELNDELGHAAQADHSTSPILWVLVGYMFLFVWRPFEIWPFLADLRIERVYMIMAIVMVMFSSTTKATPLGLHYAIACFGLTIVVCWLFSPWRDTLRATQTVEEWFKIVVFYILIVVSVRKESDLRFLVWGYCAAVGLFMVHSVWEFQMGRRMFAMGISRMNGVNATFRQPNTFAATLLYALPFFTLAVRAGTVWWLRLGGLVATALVVYCVIYTGSRTAFAGLILFAALLVVSSKRRVRVLALLALILPVAWSLAPGVVQSRFMTLFDDDYYESAGIGGKTSAEGRLQGLYDGIDLWKRYPVAGCGPGAWMPSTGSPIESHNLYGQLPGELGSIGAISFATFVLTMFSSAQVASRQLKRLGNSSAILSGTIQAVQESLVVLLFLGLAGHSLYRFNWVWYAGFLAISVQIVRSIQGEENVTETALGYSGDIETNSADVSNGSASK